jgi:hypothetical protein
MARFQISFTMGTVIYPAIELEGGYSDAKEWAEARIGHYPPGTRYHIRIWRQDPAFPAWAPCDDPNFPEC